MVALRYITPDFAVAPQLEVFDFADIAARRFGAVIDNRPDDEPGVAVASGEAGTRARHADLEFAYLPAGSNDLFDIDLIDHIDRALHTMPGPVLAYCKSGTRSAILWAVATVRHRPVDEVLDQLAAAGFDFAFLRDEFEAEAARYRACCTDRQAA